MVFVMVLTLAAGVSADLIISEISDGPLASSSDKWIELTNTGPGAIADLSIYELRTANNGGPLFDDGLTLLPAQALE